MVKKLTNLRKLLVIFVLVLSNKLGVAQKNKTSEPQYVKINAGCCIPHSLTKEEEIMPGDSLHHAIPLGNKVKLSEGFSRFAKSKDKKLFYYIRTMDFTYQVTINNNGKVVRCALNSVDSYSKHDLDNMDMKRKLNEMVLAYVKDIPFRPGYSLKANKKVFITSSTLLFFRIQ